MTVSRYFPSPMPDEYYPSIICRWSQMSGERFNAQVPITRGPVKVAPLINLQHHWLKAIKSIYSTSISDCTFEQSHTLLPLYKHWLLQRPEQEHIISMPSETAYRLLRWCPECAKQDTSRYGYPFWRVSHQIPFHIRCTKHALKLFVYDQEKSIESSPWGCNLGAISDVLNYSPEVVKAEDLSTFQRWLEQYYAQLNNVSDNIKKRIIFRISQCIDFSEERREGWAEARKYRDANKFFLQAIKTTGFNAFFPYGLKPMGDLKRSYEFSLTQLLKDARFRSPTMYLLAGWAFLGEVELTKLCFADANHDC